MSNSYYNYENVVRVIDDVYSESANACQAINDAGLTPEEFYQVASKNVVDTGIKYSVNGDGESINIFNNMNTNLSDGNVAQSAINSNMQTGTAAQSANVQYATNSSLNQAGKVELSAGVTKYKTGHLAPTTGFKAVVGSVASGVMAYAAGVSAGKAIDSFLYSRNPAFWDSIGLSTLNPQTWSSITSDMSDAGTEGALKTAFNFLLGINDDGTTQAYMNADAYKYMIYALAQNGMFDAGGYVDGTGTKPASQGGGSYPIEYASKTYNRASGVVITTEFITPMMGVACADDSGHSARWYQVARISTEAPVNKFIYRRYNNGGNIYDTPYFADDVRLERGTFEHTMSKYRMYNGKAKFYEQWNDPTDDTTSSYTAAQVDAWNFPASITSVPEEQASLPGVTNQPGATVPTGISSNSTQQQVADAIDNQYPDLHNNRIEQSVVQPDGTVKNIIYYPVPIPTATVDTTTTEAHTITIDQPIRIILPNGATITLPDGTTVTGDGVTVITLPPGTYTLPSGTKVLGNPVADPDGNPGDTQDNPQVEDDSTDTAKDLIRDAITQPSPVPTPSPDVEGQPQNDPEPTNPNPSDTGEGSSPVAPVPTGSASALYTVYNPSLGEINSLGAWLWSTNFIDQLLKMFNDPMQAIIGLHKTFITPSVSGRGNIKVGYLDSGVAANLVPTQYSTMDCGSISLPEYFGNVFDYSPYTRVYIYLPFIGFRELDVSQVMRSTINVKYHGDAYTGAALAEVKVTRDSGAGGVLYTYGCECAVRYPLSQGSYMGFATAVAGLAVGVASGNVAPALLGFAHGSGKPAVEHSGAFSGNSGAMGIKKPYLVVMRPQTAMPSNYKHYSGQPSSSKVTVGNTSGLIRVRECHVDSIPYATREEKAIIDSALHDGILVS